MASSQVFLPAQTDLITGEKDEHKRGADKQQGEERAIPVGSQPVEIDTDGRNVQNRKEGKNPSQANGTYIRSDKSFNRFFHRPHTLPKQVANDRETQHGEDEEEQA